MNVLIDTTIWSLALRRRPESLASTEKALVAQWALLMNKGWAAIIGPIRQEVLSGIKNLDAFNAVRQGLSGVHLLEIGTSDYDQAAMFFNACRASGISGSSTDYLICAVSYRYRSPIFTTDKDFARYSKHVPILFHEI